MNSFSIEQFLDLTGYEETRQNRRKAKNNNYKPTAEFFTPYAIVKKMANKIYEEECSDFFTWNFEEWRPMTDDEIKQVKQYIRS